MKFAALRAELPEFLVTWLERWQRLLPVVNEELEALSGHIESAQPQAAA